MGVWGEESPLQYTAAGGMQQGPMRAAIKWVLLSIRESLGLLPLSYLKSYTHEIKKGDVFAGVFTKPNDEKLELPVTDKSKVQGTIV